MFKKQAISDNGHQFISSSSEIIHLSANAVLTLNNQGDHCISRCTLAKQIKPLKQIRVKELLCVWVIPDFLEVVDIPLDRG